MAETKVSEEVQDEIDTLEAMYDKEELKVDMNSNLVKITYLSTVLNVIFGFKPDDMISSMKISLQNVSGTRQDNIKLIQSMINTKFEEEKESMPIYQCIQYFNDEIISNEELIKTPKHQKSKNDEKKEEVVETEYIALIRFNHLLHGKQHKKENEMLSELKNLKNCSATFFGLYFYGKPGVVCICATSNIIESYAKKCNQIGKKSVISLICDIKKEKVKVEIDKNTVKSIASGNNEKLSVDELISLLTDLQFKEVKNTLSTILTGNAVDFN